MDGSEYYGSEHEGEDEEFDDPSMADMECDICLETVTWKDPGYRARHGPGAGICVRCVTCLERSFKLAAQERHFFPADCCGVEIPLAVLLRCAPELADEPMPNLPYRYWGMERQVNDGALALYCPKPDCGGFVPEMSFSEDLLPAQCPSCLTRVCTECKNVRHEGRECAVDTAREELRVMAAQEGWTECSCGEIVTRNGGCPVVRCKCGEDLCFVCHEKLRECRHGRD